LCEPLSDDVAYRLVFALVLVVLADLEAEERAALHVDCALGERGGSALVVTEEECEQPGADVVSVAPRRRPS